MRILFYCATPLDELGGAEASALLLAEALRRRGHDVGIVESAPSRSAQTYAPPFGGPVWSIPLPTYPARRPWLWRSFLRSMYRFQTVVRTFRPDIVSIQSACRQTLPVIGACALPHRWRLVVTAHGSDIKVYSVEDPTLRMWLSRVFTRADAVTAVSKSLLRDLITQYPVARRRRSQVIHNGIDLSWFDQSHDTPPASQARYVLYVGRLEQIKGVDILLRAWQLFQANVPRVALWLAGDGSAMDDLRALSQHLGLAEQVRFLGRIPARDLGALYRNAELVVMPSRSEGLPLVALEAGGCGTICVATRVGGVPEVIEDKVTGFLVDPESPTALVQVMAGAIRLPLADRRRMGIAAKERIAQHFSHERTTDAYEELFRSLVVPRATVSQP